MPTQTRQTRMTRRARQQIANANVFERIASQRAGNRLQAPTVEWLRANAGRRGH